MNNKQLEKGVWDLDDVKEEAHANTTQWGMIGEKSYKGLPNTNEILPTGIYNVSLDRNDDRSIFIRRDMQMDEIMDLKEPKIDKILDEVAGFWSKESAFKKMGFLHRRGYLLYGPGGTGKSVVVKQLMHDVVSEGGLVLLCDNPVFFNKALTTFRQAEPNRRVLCVFEDIEAIIIKHGDDELLSLLDGANMVNHVLNVATTNYPELLDRRIISRPRRFDRVIKIDIPSDDVRRRFFKSQIKKITKKKLEDLVDLTEGLSLAALSEVTISVYCLGNTMKETVEILTRMKEGNPSSEEFGTSEEIGFSSESDKDDELD